MESMASGMTMTSTTTTTTAPVVASELTSTTAPGKVFTSRAELAAHYKSDWHKYNLKRREAGLPVLLESDFQARLEAAKAMRQEKQAGTGHLKADKKNANTNNNNSSSTSNKQGKKKQQQQRDDTTSSQGVTIISPTNPLEEVKGEAPAQEEVMAVAAGEPAAIPAQPQQDVVSPTTTTAAEGEEEEAAAIEIEPRQCLFDPHTSVSVQANVERMQRKYGFFIPDVEYLTDMEGLVGFCHEKIKLGQTCLYCQRIFTSWQGCQKHMIAKNHTKIRYEAGIDMEDFAVFYDFSAADAEFLDSIGRHNKKSGNNNNKSVSTDDKQGDEKEEAVEEPIAEEGEGDAGEWEDVSEDDKDAKGDDDNEEEDDDENLYEGFEDQVARLGFDVTILGELVLPDGRIVGHRSLRRYYKQRAPRVNDNAAVLAARSAASERLYRGQVYSIGNGAGTSSALVAAQAGIHPALVAGRAGKGILVPSTGGFFSQLSIYRYRAAIRKQRAGDVQGQRLYNKTNQNMNRMDKKANRLMNGVSVAHAKR